MWGEGWAELKRMKSNYRRESDSEDATLNEGEKHSYRPIGFHNMDGRGAQGERIMMNA